MTKRQKRILGIGGVLAVAIAVLFISNHSVVAPTVLSDTGMAIAVSDQKVKNEIWVQNVTLSKPGFVVVHKDLYDAPGDIVAVSDYLEVGSYKDVKVFLQDEVTSGMKLFALIHEDTGDGEFNAEYDFTALNDKKEVFAVPFVAK